MSKRERTLHKGRDTNGNGAVAEHDQIAARAFELWQSRGCPIGSPEEDWRVAEEELQREPEQHVKTFASTS